MNEICVSIIIIIICDNRQLGHDLKFGEIKLYQRNKKIKFDRSWTDRVMTRHKILTHLISIQAP